jgi:hypothetical protein
VDRCQNTRLLPSGRALAALFVYAVPLALALVPGIVACIRHRPVVASIVAGLYGTLPWLVMALLFGYLSLAVSTQRLNDEFCIRIAQQAENEPQALASLAGRPWPGH